MSGDAATGENPFESFDAFRVPSPCFVVDEAQVERNLKLLHEVQERSGAKVLAALKAFSMWHLAPLSARYLSGTCASGLHEALLGRNEYGGEVHAYSAAYSQTDLAAILEFADHVIFNSPGQWRRFRTLALAAREQRNSGRERGSTVPALQFGLRINPEHSEGSVPLYDPCAPGSRLGMTAEQMNDDLFDGVSGLHFHTLCEQGLEPLQRTLAVVERNFGQWFERLDWINFGGGHHITAPGYDVQGLIDLIRDFTRRYGLQVYLEPGEAVAIHTGVLVSEVLDIQDSAFRQTILDTSATCHMPDTLEMPYRPDVLGAGVAGEHAHTHRLGGMTCLAGDIIGDYSFTRPLAIGDRLVFDDMSHYTMVKTSTFNGIRLPAIAVWNSTTDELRMVREFGYEDFRQRLS